MAAACWVFLVLLFQWNNKWDRNPIFPVFFCFVMTTCLPQIRVNCRWNFDHRTGSCFQLTVGSVVVNRPVQLLLLQPANDRRLRVNGAGEMCCDLLPQQLSQHIQKYLLRFCWNFADSFCFFFCFCFWKKKLLKFCWLSFLFSFFFFFFFFFSLPPQIRTN